MSRIWKIAITGGPCGGKTSGIPIVRDFFESRGYKVFTIPEAVTIVKDRIGLDFGDVPNYNFQSIVTDTMLFFEEEFIQCAKSFKHCHMSFEQDIIILCDRGIMDNMAYMHYGQFARLLEAHNLSETEALQRYDAVFHLVTAADGAEEYYKLEGIRHEDLDTARKLDTATRNAWSNHPCLRVIDNSTNFNKKIDRLIWGILEIILGL